MRRVTIGAIALGVAISGGLAVPRAASAAFVTSTVCAGSSLISPFNTFTLNDGLTGLPVLNNGSYTKNYSLTCVPIGVLPGVTVLPAPSIGTYSESGFFGDCLVADGPYRITSVGTEVFLGDSVVIGVGDQVDEVDVLVPQTTRDIPCLGYADPSNPGHTVLHMSTLLDVQTELPTQVP